MQFMDTRVQKGNTSDDSGVVDAGCEGDEDDDAGGGGAVVLLPMVMIKKMSMVHVL